MGIVCGYSEENPIADQESDDDVSEAGPETREDDAPIFESDSEQCFGSNFDDCSSAGVHCFLLWFLSILSIALLGVCE